ncbi:MAG: HAMP domain-containing histidine kinase [Desulfovibrio sp.]|nr:HAMP domain-containing histidine kinase [Desulfovibrio sp.]
MSYRFTMYGHPLLSALLGQLDSLERSARELRMPLLAGQTEALRQSVIGVVAERSALEETAAIAVMKAKRLEMGIEENRRRYEETLRSFERFRQGFEIIESLRSLDELPDMLERLRGLFKVGMFRLYMDQHEYGKYLPKGFPLLDSEELRAMAGSILSAGSRSYVGPALQAPPGLLTPAEARRWGSCYAYPLEDRFHEGQWAGLILLTDLSPDRYRLDMATDYMEHFSDALASAVVDVTDRRKAEELREDVELITRHDLKSPLSAILTLPQFLLEADNLTDRQKEMVRLMLVAGRRMQSMITLSLSLYRMERGTYELAADSLDLAALVRSIWEEGGGPYRSARMGLDLQTPEPQFFVLGEELLCYTMLANLINNALEASKPGETVAVRLFREEGWAVVEVANSRDVPEEIRERFFEKYATWGKQSGTGLGTYTARMIAEVHGGSIELHTGMGQGTIVRVRLPDGPNGRP